MSAQPDPFHDRDLLRDLAHAGAEHARSSLQALLGDEISVLEARAWRSPKDADALFARGDTSPTRVGRLEISGPPHGTAWVLVPDSCVQRLIERYGSEDADGSMAHSIAAEVANIVTGAYVIEAGNHWGVDLDPSPADLSVCSDTARNDLDAALLALEHALAGGCDFGDSEGSYGLSVVVMLDGSGGGW